MRHTTVHRHIRHIKSQAVPVVQHTRSLNDKIEKPKYEKPDWAKKEKFYTVSNGTKTLYNLSESDAREYQSHGWKILDDYEKELKIIYPEKKLSWLKENKHRLLNKELDELEELEVVSNLDMLEKRQFDMLMKNKALTSENIDDALKIIINSVDGDKTQLSDKLVKYGESKGWFKGFNSDEYEYGLLNFLDKKSVAIGGEDLITESQKKEIASKIKSGELDDYLDIEAEIQKRYHKNVGIR